jgi:hypothetical protein
MLVAVAAVGEMNGPWYALTPVNVNRSTYGFGSLDDAKAAAEAAVRKTWT